MQWHVTSRFCWQITYAESVIRSGYADAAVYSNLACAQLLRADVNKAFDALDKARIIDPSLPQPVFLRALALSKMKKFSPIDTLTAIFAALRLLPREVVVQRLAVEVLVRCERSDARSDDVKRMISEVRDRLSAAEHAPREKTFVLYARPYIMRLTSPDHSVSGSFSETQCQSPHSSPMRIEPLVIKRAERMPEIWRWLKLEDHRFTNQESSVHSACFPFVDAFGMRIWHLWTRKAGLK